MILLTESGGTVKIEKNETVKIEKNDTCISL